MWVIIIEIAAYWSDLVFEQIRTELKQGGEQKVSKAPTSMKETQILKLSSLIQRCHIAHCRKLHRFKKCLKNRSILKE